MRSLTYSGVVTEPGILGDVTARSQRTGCFLRPSPCVESFKPTRLLLECVDLVSCGAVGRTVTD